MLSVWARRFATRRRVVASVTVVTTLIVGLVGILGHGSLGGGPHVVKGSAALPVGTGGAHAGPNAELVSEPSSCSGCTPPLLNNQGSVLGTATQAGQLSLTPIYWVPTGTSIDPQYSGVVNQFINDTAAASGQTNNVYSVNTEYYRPPSPGGGDKIKYQISATAPITITNAFPAGCTSPTAGYTKCVQDAAVQSRLSAVLAANSLPTGLGHMYLVIFPPNVDIQDGGGEYASSAWCGIHGAYDSTTPAGPVIYSEIPYPPSGCNHGQFPQYGLSGTATQPTADGDTIISTISHEINEAITDPSLDGDVSWVDSTGHEIGDECSGIYGKPLGSTDPSDPQETEYNQVLNGHFYWTQETFSDLSFKAFGAGQGCVQKAFVPKGADGATTPAPDFGSSQVAASPHVLTPDGTATSSISDTVLSPNGEPVVGDEVSFSVQTADGDTGTCGDLSGGTTSSQGAISGMTDANGQVSVTYTASTDDVACTIMASEAEGGTSDATTLAQGTAISEIPSLNSDNFPTTITTGTPVFFTTTAHNPHATALNGALTTIYLSGDNLDNAGLVSSQVDLQYSNATTGGTFVPAPVDGTTVGDGFISGTTLPDTGSTIAPKTDEVTTWKLTLAAGARPSTATTQLNVEADLDQVNPASGSQSNLDAISQDSTVVAGSATTPATTPPTTTATTVIYVVTEPTKTVIQTVPAPASKPAGCKVPKLARKSVTKVKAALKKAKCTSTTLIVPTGRKGSSIVFKSSTPKPDSNVAAGGTITVRFKLVRSKR